jgi:hypothetical protein
VTRGRGERAVEAADYRQLGRPVKVESEFYFPHNRGTKYLNQRSEKEKCPSTSISWNGHFDLDGQPSREGVVRLSCGAFARFIHAETPPPCRGCSVLKAAGSQSHFTRQAISCKAVLMCSHEM